MDTHFHGTLAVTRAFAPQLAEQEHSAILNVLSVLSWVSLPNIGAYCAAKAAEWSLTNALRVELAPQRTQVSSLHVGYMDTDMAAGVEAPKVSPESVVEATLEALRTGQPEVLADDASRFVKSQLSSGVEALYPALVAS
jgi:NAD(P)-dependent dehydrogenase (short-subunit alcohol dehydrogenase family)